VGPFAGLPPFEPCSAAKLHLPISPPPNGTQPNTRSDHECFSPIAGRWGRFPIRSPFASEPTFRPCNCGSISSSMVPGAKQVGHSFRGYKLPSHGLRHTLPRHLWGTGPPASHVCLSNFPSASSPAPTSSELARPNGGFRSTYRASPVRGPPAVPITTLVSGG